MSKKDFTLTDVGVTPEEVASGRRWVSVGGDLDATVLALAIAIFKIGL